MTATQASSDTHYPVMLPEVLAALSPKDGGVYVDGTFGAGGYTRAILEAANCTVYAIDRDDNARITADGFDGEYGDRFNFLRGCFGDVKSLLQAAGVERVDGFVLDVGVSSMQIDEAERGFSFRFDGPLDMRMDMKSDGQTAADIVNTYGQDALANVIYEYGDERKSRRIARKIIELREEKPFERTLELADAVRSVVPKTHKDKIDPATRTFQALRIAVNDELGELERALDVSEDILSEDGRLVVVAFHSLEDGRVKRFLKEKSNTQAKGSRHLPQSVTSDVEPIFTLNSRKAIKPSDKEVAENPRSRSARLRAGIRCPLNEGRT
ncbi:MAG: 16S rRNA (cytosine(1402)-N(4))-methyltransferase [Alphaproteobacteria bacterium]|nr:MAG: 16S rRNA (cytosine(1402)-N(4))-methyltransferase [Alphaproteobacteria bacterium]